MWADDVARLRGRGESRCLTLNHSGKRFAQMLGEAGLRQNENLLSEIDPPIAIETLEKLLRYSMVDNIDVMSVDDAKKLSKDFFKDTHAEGVKFYTNGDWLLEGSHGWNPLTDSVFDGGVIAFGPTIFACVWIEEDA